MNTYTWVFLTGGDVFKRIHVVFDAGIILAHGY